jgi:uncharacterized SAM-binding protein YcdF (DUF218 family)
LLPLILRDSAPGESKAVIFFLHDQIHFIRMSLPVLLAPPAGLLWLFVLGAIIRRWRLRLSNIVMGLAFAGLYILSMPIVGGALIASLETAAHPLRDTLEPAAIIVLGGDGQRTSDPLVTAEPGPLSLERLAGAATLARQKNLPVLITGGSVGQEEAPVADLMATMFADAFSLPVMWRETKSETTCENARFSARILRKSGIQSAYVVTHDWHMQRAILSFERAGYPILPAPLPGDIHKIEGIGDFLPHTNAWGRSALAIHEWIGLIAYRLGACPYDDDAASTAS